jgi:sugar diacid utilization regulator
MTNYKVPLLKQLQMVSSLIYDGWSRGDATVEAAKRLGLHYNTVRYNLEKTIKQALKKYL